MARRGITVEVKEVDSPAAAEPLERSDPWSQLDPVLATTIMSAATLATLLAIPQVRLAARRIFRRTGWKSRPF